jgi:hypothetical protein
MTQITLNAHQIQWLAQTLVRYLPHIEMRKRYILSHDDTLSLTVWSGDEPEGGDTYVSPKPDRAIDLRKMI